MAKKKPNYSELIRGGEIPRHIAIIMDGNGRWARKRLMPRNMGHRAGMSSLKQVVQACDEIGVKVLTVYAFSTENWKRPVDEVDYLMKLLVEFMHKELAELNEKGVRINMLGSPDTLPRDCQTEIEDAVRLTRDNQGMVFNIALNYGSRREILDAVINCSKDIAAGKMATKDLNEEVFSSYLYTGGLPDPDLLIRTAGEMRISNFLLWQIAYTELWVSECPWPDFTRADLCHAIYDYQRRERRFGGLITKSQDEDNA
ncbi:MAG: isoprenyl transferase [Syntrophomonadaceae bacterium]|nr:isoprenyl transferase [Syntrophomonadaceae bacterium]